MINGGENGWCCSRKLLFLSVDHAFFVCWSLEHTNIQAQNLISLYMSPTVPVFLREVHLFPGQLVSGRIFQHINFSACVLRGSHQNRIVWVRRETWGSSNPTSGSTQHHPKSRSYICECCPNTPWTPADLDLLPCQACVPASGFDRAVWADGYQEKIETSVVFFHLYGAIRW